MREFRIENLLLNDQADSFQRICLEGQVSCVVFYKGDKPDKSNIDLSNIFSHRGFKPYLVPEDFLIKGKQDLKVYEEIINSSCLFIFYIDDNRSSFLYCLGHIRAKNRPIITFCREQLLLEISSEYENELKSSSPIYEIDFNKLSEIGEENNSLVNFMASLDKSKNFVLKGSADDDGNIFEIDNIIKDIFDFLIPNLRSIFKEELDSKLSKDLDSVSENIFDYYFGLKKCESSDLLKLLKVEPKDKSLKSNPIYRTLINIIFSETINYLSSNLTDDSKTILVEFEEFIKIIDENVDDKKNAIQIISSLNNKGIAYLILSYFKERDSFLEKSLSLFDKANNLIKTDLIKEIFSATEINTALAYEYKSDLNPDDGYLNDSLHFIKNAEKRFEGRKDDFSYGLVLNSKANCFRKTALISKNTGELELAVDEGKNASKVFESKDQKLHRFSAILNISISLMYKSKLTSDKQFCEEALDNLEQGFSLLNNSTDTRLYGKASVIKAVIYETLFELEKSVDFLQKSIESYKNSLKYLGGEPDSKYIGIVNNQIGVCYNYLSETGDKVQNCRNSLQFHKSAITSLSKDDNTYEYAYFRMCEGNSFRLLAE
ncbi:MAG: hypothetical protein IH795_08805, partial [Bacteroidetes bacterium]|nr:hypothetical protein [Bacteroidota bacterium]